MANAVLLLGGLIVGGNDVLMAAGLWPVAPWGWLRVAHALPGLWSALSALAVVLAVIFPRGGGVARTGSRSAGVGFDGLWNI